MINHRPSKRTDVLILQPGHKRCYFHDLHSDFQEQMIFLEIIRKPALGYFNKLTIQASINHDHPVLVWFVKDEDND